LDTNAAHLTPLLAHPIESAVRFDRPGPPPAALPSTNSTASRAQPI